jgi:hypothetical protein
MPSFAEPFAPTSTFSARRSLRTSKSRPNWIWLALIVSGLWSLGGCATTQRVKLDYRIPHQISETCQLSVWSVLPDGRAVSVPVTIEPGWWIASPLLIEAP